MKTSIVFIAVLGLLTFLSCNQNNDVNSMLKNRDTREEIFSSISNNPDYMSDFRDYMQGHNKAGNMMMKGNMNGMNHSGRMMNMRDSTAMMQSFLNNHRMMSNMVQMMHNRGMMSVECMNQTMNKMNKKMPTQE